MYPVLMGLWLRSSIRPKQCMQSRRPRKQSRAAWRCAINPSQSNRWELPAPAGRTTPEHLEDTEEDEPAEERYTQFGYAGEFDDE
jgi:hypothetical protein